MLMYFLLGVLWFPGKVLARNYSTLGFRKFALVLNGCPSSQCCDVLIRLLVHTGCTLFRIIQTFNWSRVEGCCDYIHSASFSAADIVKRKFTGKLDGCLLLREIFSWKILHSGIIKRRLLKSQYMLLNPSNYHDMHHQLLDVCLSVQKFMVQKLSMRLIDQGRPHYDTALLQPTCMHETTCFPIETKIKWKIKKFFE